MEEGYCIACQYGQHDEHIEYPEIPAPGVMGGWHCPCKGECVDQQPREVFEEFIHIPCSQCGQALLERRPGPEGDVLACPSCGDLRG